MGGENYEKGQTKRQTIVLKKIITMIMMLVMVIEIVE